MANLDDELKKFEEALANASVLEEDEPIQEQRKEPEDEIYEVPELDEENEEQTDESDSDNSRSVKDTAEDIKDKLDRVKEEIEKEREQAKSSKKDGNDLNKPSKKSSDNTKDTKNEAGNRTDAQGGNSLNTKNTGMNSGANGATSSGSYSASGAGTTGSASTASGGASTASGATAGSGTAGASGAASAGTAGTAAVAAPIGGAIIAIIIVIVIWLLIIGFVTFWVDGLGIISEKFHKLVDDIWTNLASIVDGADKAQVQSEQLIGVATLLEKNGYSLENYGFLDTDGKKTTTDKETGEIINSSGDTILTRKILENGEDGEITFIASKTIWSYLVAENRTYLLENKTWNLADFIGSIIGTSKGIGSGMIRIEASHWSGIDAILWNDADINRETKQLVLHGKVPVSEDGTTSTTGEMADVELNYSLDGWTRKIWKIIRIFINSTFSNNVSRLCNRSCTTSRL